MNIVVGIGNEHDALLAGDFLKGATADTQVTALAAIHQPGRLSGLIRSRRQSHNALRRLAEIEEAHASVLLSAFADEMRQRGVQTETAVVLGNPAEELIKAAKSRRADAILVGKCHNDEGSSDVLGHVAARVARYAPCSVILLRPENPSPKVFMLATDGSPQSDQSAHSLITLPVAGVPDLLICTVVAPFNPVFIKPGALGFKEYEQFMASIEEEEIETAQQVLDRVAAQFEGSHFRVRKLALTGDAADALLKSIPRYHVDFLALGAKGISSAAGFLLGSITLKLLNRAPCSILIAR